MRFVISLLILLGSGLSFGQNQSAFEYLVNNTDRPTVLEDLPYLVVGLELFYPNGQYAFLGRDASGAADVLEAFYLSIGQMDQ